MSKKFNYYWYEFNADCIELASKLDQYRGKLINVFGVPRGGIPIAVRLASLLDLPLTTKPILQTLIVDDVVDTGKTIERYAMFPYFVSLHYKPWATRKPLYYIHLTEKWVIYPWEVGNESLYPGQENG